ncbi:MAG: class I mannose-6-phosphate isomerase [Bacteroidales bacterium]|nr:class I mannose-6-phosphate isomerase [Bacteroidales bacterium]
MKPVLYPLLFYPNLHPLVWGGDRLTRFKGLPSQDRPIGESWEVSVIPYSTSTIANGDLAGRNLADVIAENPVEILGEAVAAQYQNKLPLLAKFIDAKHDLSIQVHPNDEMARMKYGKLGKSEMWYIIDAEPGSFLYAGFNREISLEEYHQRISDGTFCEVLAKHEVKKGDVFYLPAGRVHAICGGIMLAEIQQSSDITYRIFDYNRPGMDGKPRELHTVLAAKALDFHVVDEYRTEYSAEDNRACHVIDSPYFSVRLVNTTKPFHRNLIKYDSFIISMCISGNCKIRIRSTGYEIQLQEGNSCLIPATIADYDIIPECGGVKLLDAYIDKKDRSFVRKVTRFLHLTRK